MAGEDPQPKEPGLRTDDDEREPDRDRHCGHDGRVPRTAARDDETRRGGDEQYHIPQVRCRYRSVVKPMTASEESHCNSKGTPRDEQTMMTRATLTMIGLRF